MTLYCTASACTPFLRCDAMHLVNSSPRFRASTHIRSVFLTPPSHRITSYALPCHRGSLLPCTASACKPLPRCRAVHQLVRPPPAAMYQIARPPLTATQFISLYALYAVLLCYGPFNTPPPLFATQCRAIIRHHPRPMRGPLIPRYPAVL